MHIATANRDNTRPSGSSGSLRNPLASLSGKLIAGAFTVAITLVALGATLGGSLLQVADASQRNAVLGAGALASSQLNVSLSDSRYYSLSYSQRAEPALMDQAKASLAAAKSRLVETRKMALDVDPATAESMQWLHYQVEGFESELKALESSVDRYGPTQGGDGLANAVAISGEQLSANARKIEQDLSTASASAAQAMEEGNASMIEFMLAVFGIIIILVTAFAIFFARDVARALKRITAAMTSLAQGNRAISIPCADRRDEIGEMAQALAVFHRSADELARLQEEAARRASDQLTQREQADAERNRLLTDVAERFERTVGQVVTSVATSSSQLQSTANSMASAATQASQFAESAVFSMDATHGGVSAAAMAGDQFSESINEISQQAASSAELARSACDSAEMADSMVHELVDAVSEVDQIVRLIGSIASQTNILALNASIEAARSDSGKGFGVVAAEVKNLADQTARATDQVAAQIVRIQKATRTSVDGLQAISKQVRQLQTNASAIAVAVDEQTIASRELAMNLDRAAGGTQEIRGNIGEVREMSLTTGSAASQVLTSAQSLDRHALQLRSQMDEFLQFVRAA